MLMSTKEVAAKWGVSRGHVRVLEERGVIPAPVRLPCGRREWRTSETMAALDRAKKTRGEFISIGEFAAAIGKSRRTVRRWIGAGLLPEPCATPTLTGRPVLAWPRARMRLWLEASGQR